MPKLRLDPKSMKSALASARIVKPSSKDLVIRIRGQFVQVISQDARSRSVSIVPAITADCDDTYLSEDYYLSSDRHGILEANLQSVTLSETEKNLNIKYEDDTNVRQAQVRKRADNSRRPKFQEITFPDGGIKFKASEFAEILNYVSGSAQIGDTKTDQDMKINQIHFYANEMCSYSNARTYASVVLNNSILFDASLVASDIPAIRAFCSKSSMEDILIKFADGKCYIYDEAKTRLLVCSLVKAARPSLILYSEDSHEVELKIDLQNLKDNLNWATTAIEGTNKLIFRSVSDGSSVYLDLIGPNGQTGKLPITFVKGNEMDIVIQINILLELIGHIDGDMISLKIGHPKLLDTLEISNSTDGKTRVRHFMKYLRDVK